MKKHALVFTFGLTLVLGVQLPTVSLASSGNVCELAFESKSLTATKSALEQVQKKDIPNFWAKAMMTLRNVKSDSSLDADHVESWVLAHFFFDRLEVASSTSREFADLVHLWDETNEASPFLPFRKTFENGLAQIRLRLGAKLNPNPPLTIESIAEVHRSMMSGKPSLEDAQNGHVSWSAFVKDRVFSQWKNVEDIRDEDIGEIRSVQTGFRLDLKPGAKLPLFKNPLILGGKRDIVGMVLPQAWAFYASLLDIDRFAAQLSPNVRTAVEEARGANSLNEENGALIKMVVRDLLESAIRDHQTAIAKAKTLDERVETHARFVWKFVSIHPFLNGNGRTARVLLGRLLMGEGLLPPLLKNQNDVLISVDAYVEQVKEGVVLATRFMDDLIWRAQNGWEIARSPIALLSRLPKRIYFDSKQSDIGERYADVDVYDFAQFLRMNPAQLAAKGETGMLRDYVNHLKRWTAYRAKTGDEYQVRFVPAEMQQAALQIDAPNGAKWLTKKNLFYSSELAWRGISTTVPLNLDELLAIFTSPSSISLSMNSSAKQGAEIIADSVREDFATFNRAVLDPKIYFKMSADHMNAEGNYANSPLLSAAMNRAVADRFSKGFLMDGQSIMNQRGQLVIAALAPEFGTSYFNRLGPISKRLGLGFVSKYPRQMEIAIAGVMAPDSVMRVEYRDVKVLKVAENTGEAIAGDTDVKSITILERDTNEPAVIKVTVTTGEGVVTRVRKFKITTSDGQVSFTEIK